MLKLPELRSLVSDLFNLKLEDVGMLLASLVKYVKTGLSIF